MKQVMLFDGVCNLCNGWVNFVIDRDKQSRYKFAALQGEAGRAMMTRVGKSEFLSSCKATQSGVLAFLSHVFAGCSLATSRTPMIVLLLAGPDDLSTLVLVEWERRETGGEYAEGQGAELLQEREPAEHVYIKSEAVLRVCKYLCIFPTGTRARRRNSRE